MLQIKSYGQHNIKGVQVDFSSSSLNTNDVFIICHKSSAFYIWCGKRSTGDQREAAKSILAVQKREPEMVIETQERDEFWQAIGGKKSYTLEKRAQVAPTQTIVRLFEAMNLSSISNSGVIVSNGNSGSTSVSRVSFAEVYLFSQEDLSPYEIMLLDAWDSIFIWIGSSKKIILNV